MSGNGHEADSVAQINVIGVGGGGSNAVSRMHRDGVSGIEYMIVNTDAQALKQADVPIKIRIGDHLTDGKGGGGNPEMGAMAAEESRVELHEAIRGADMTFIAAGMGGGTGTGAAPVIAEMARECGALAVGVVTRPFDFEGAKRAEVAEQGIAELRTHLDTLIVIPNERLHLLYHEEITAENAFRAADDVLRLAVQSIAELVTVSGDINVDFADVQTIMRDAGQAWMSIGWGSGENRAKEAALNAISNPLADSTIDGARGVLFNITGGSDLKLSEVHEAAEVLQRLVDPDAEIIFGMVSDVTMEGRVKLTVIATGFPTPGTTRQTEEEINQMLEEALNQESADLDLPPFLRRRPRVRS